ncbi:hypothetical protein [Pseudomonas lactis]|uniref:Uncharacterized protein n=1 Tax=Pseudomonas lactis TaxID=1615674 RepID=A0A7Y1QDU3_9PSED|nr:hypothetical protein [Pseudomonas lactis]NNA73480.1 hypothetical protein [Pseudomonas lactis]NNA77610.1 hypothetical protein [Pseudomonas lactis]
MKTVKFDATVLTVGQRRRLAEQQQVRSCFINPILAHQVDQTLKAVDELKEQGTKPERIWFVERQGAGTISVAEWMGF